MLLQTMVKRQHSGGSQIARAGFVVVLIGILIYGFRNWAPYRQNPDDLLLPTTKRGKIVKHHYYTLSYSEDDELAEWVTYRLTVERLKRRHAKRTNWFEEDPYVSTGSAAYADYKGSGYDKGHLVPAADMAFDKTAMEETFFMSNISPQVHNFNGGIWRELEELTRDWAKMNKELYIVTGPVFKDNKGTIGRKSKVTVPGYFYKVILDLEGPEKKAIGFVIPNEVSTRPLSDYVRTVDAVEALTGIDFFPTLDDALEDSLESHVNNRQWPLKNSLYRTRIQQWNLR